MCLVHHESLYLMKHRRVRGIVIMAVNRAGDNNLQRRLAAFHSPNLDRRGVRPEQSIVGDENRILHIPRRMIFGKIQRFKIMVIVLDVGATGDLETQTVKDLDNLIDHQRERMRLRRAQSGCREV